MRNPVNGTDPLGSDELYVTHKDINIIRGKTIDFLVPIAQSKFAVITIMTTVCFRGRRE